MTIELWFELEEHETAIEYKEGYIVVRRDEYEEDNLVRFTASVEHEGWWTERCVPNLRTLGKAIEAGKRLYDEYEANGDDSD